MLRVVKTEDGFVRGIPAADPRYTAFKGIPFAAPPVGENRWRAPQPAANWDGVRECYTFAPISVQDTPGLGTDIYCREWHVDPEIPMDEDCLYLNVWTGAKSADEKLPVVVWFFGGGFQWGYPAEMEFDGERVARRGVVVVSVNYRLNVFGFMAHPELTAKQSDAPTNFGLLDQQAGLKWVQRNIAAFGGDPEKVTIAGQSAGGGSVMAQVTCPNNVGLFRGAIVQSGLISSPYDDGGFGNEPLASAEKNGEEFLKFLGVSSIDEARKIDAKTLLAKYGEYVPGIMLGATEGPHRMFPVADMKFCFGNSMKLFMEGKHVPVALMAGNTGDEFPSAIFAKSEEEFVEKAKAWFGDKADEFLAFPEAKVKGGMGGMGYAPISGIECAVKSVALKAQENGDGPVYYYRFEPDIPGWDNPGTFHSVELWFFFETLAKCWRPFVGRHYDLARQMCDYWSNFIKFGNPNGQGSDGNELPKWLPYTKEGRDGMSFQSCGATPQHGETEFMRFLVDKKIEATMK